MQLHRAVFDNFGIHRALDLQFRPGINGIIGPNGSGKSTVLDGLRLAFTGVSVSAGKVADNISHGEKTAAVTVEFGHNDEPHTITRRFAVGKTAQKLTTPKFEITRQAEIEEYLCELFDTTIDAMLNNVFVAQGQIDSILFSTQTQRLREMQQTVGLVRAADAEKALSTEISAYNITIGLAEQIEAVLESLRVSTVEETALRQELGALDREIEALLPYKDVLREVLESERHQTATARAKQQLDEAVMDLTEAEETTRLIQADFDSSHKLAQSLAEEAERFRIDLATADAALKRFNTAADIRAQLAKIENELAVFTSIPTEESIAAVRGELESVQENIALRQAQLRKEAPRKQLPAEIEAFAEQAALQIRFNQLQEKIRSPIPGVAEASSDIKRLRKDLVVFATGTCPTCHQDVQDFDPARTEAEIKRLETLIGELQQTRLRETGAEEAVLTPALQQIQLKLDQFEAAAQTALANALKAAQRQVETLRSKEQQLSVALRTYDGLRTRYDMLQKQLKGLGPVDTVQVDVVSMRRVVSDYDALLASTAEINIRLNVAVSDVANAKKNVAKAQQLCVSLGDTRVIAPKQIAEANAKVSELQAKVALRDGGLQRLGILEAKMEAQRVQAQRLHQQFTSEEKQSKWVGLCRRVRDIVHVSGLPSLLMREYAGVLNRRVSHYLGLWEAPFVLRLDDDLTFQADFPDGLTHVGARLSGGQKIVASTSFRLAMVDIFARQVGLLVLDEPSNYLDKDNVVHLQNLLTRLKVHASATGRQVILVTHEESLMGHFDHSITISK